MSVPELPPVVVVGQFLRLLSREEMYWDTTIKACDFHVTLLVDMTLSLTPLVCNPSTPPTYRLTHSRAHASYCWSLSNFIRRIQSQVQVLGDDGFGNSLDWGRWALPP